MSSQGTKVRITLDVSPQLNERIERLVQTTDAVSKAEVVRHSVNLYEYFIAKVMTGHTFRAVSRSGMEESIVIVGAIHMAASDEFHDPEPEK